MKKRLRNKLFKRLQFASVRCGEGQLNINGYTNPNMKTFMKKHCNVFISEWFDEPSKEELNKTLNRLIK